LFVFELLCKFAFVFAGKTGYKIWGFSRLLQSKVYKLFRLFFKSITLRQDVKSLSLSGSAITAACLVLASIWAKCSAF